MWRYYLRLVRSINKHGIYRVLLAIIQISLAHRLISVPLLFISSRIWMSVNDIVPSLLGRLSNQAPLLDLRLCSDSGNRVCHIFGNGVSALHSKNIVKLSDYVITMNLGVLLPVKQDLWITELGQASEYGDENIRSKGIERVHQLASFARSENPNVFCILKNVWPLNVSINNFDTANQFVWIKDFLIRFEPTNNQIQKILEMYLSSKRLLIPQIYSTALTAILIASKMGFERIFLHGIDGKGPHFFHSEDLGVEHVTHEYSSLLAWAREEQPRVPFDINHGPGIGVLSLLPRYIDALKGFGIHVTKVESDFYLRE